MGINGKNAINVLYLILPKLIFLNKIIIILQPIRKIKNSLINKVNRYNLNFKLRSNDSKNTEFKINPGNPDDNNKPNNI